MTLISFFLNALLLSLLPPVPVIVHGAVQGAAEEVAVAETRLPSVPERPLPSLDAAKAPALSAAAAGVWDPTYERMLFAKNAAVAHPIASITKLMTVLVALERGVALDANLTITSDDNDPEGTRLPVRNGAVLSVHDLLAATLIESANNAAEALVRATGIPEHEFVAAMNGRAAGLHLGRTRFTDVTGLGPKNVSTVEDLVRLARAAFAQPLVQQATTMPSYDIRDQATKRTITIRSTNQLLGTIPFVAAKTGYTDAAGGAMVSRLRGHDNRELVIIVLGSQNQQSRFNDTKALAEWAFANTVWPSSKP